MVKIQKILNLQEKKQKSYNFASPQLSELYNFKEKPTLVQKSLISYLQRETSIKKQGNLAKKVDYLEQYAISYNGAVSGDNRNKKKRIDFNSGSDELVPECCSGFMGFECKTCGKVFYKALLCGREWCPECGSDGSWVHRRRMASWWDKMMQMNSVGYLVVTMPEELQKHILSDTVQNAKNILQDIRRYWIRKLKFEYNDFRGLCRYHWVGDDGSKWYPHLNFLLDLGWVDDGVLDRWRSDYLRWIESKYDLTIKAKTTVIWYNYAGSTGQKVHWLKYITRSTLRVRPSMFIEDILYRFKNSVVFGHFEDPVDGTQKLASLEGGKCPYCGTKLECLGFVGVGQFNMFNDKKHLDGGWFEWVPYNDWGFVPEQEYIYNGCPVVTSKNNNGVQLDLFDVSKN